jgi:hypothetical protein
MFNYFVDASWFFRASMAWQKVGNLVNSTNSICSFDKF